jgi:hypothetical protein
VEWIQLARVGMVADCCERGEELRVVASELVSHTHTMQQQSPECINFFSHSSYIPSPSHHPNSDGLVTGLSLSNEIFCERKRSQHFCYCLFLRQLTSWRGYSPLTEETRRPTDCVVRFEKCESLMNVVVVTNARSAACNLRG